MPRYYFHLHNGTDTYDEEGQDLPGLEEARHEAVLAARGIMIEEIRRGELTLSHWIEVRDAGGTQLLALRFDEALAVTH